MKKLVVGLAALVSATALFGARETVTVDNVEDLVREVRRLTGSGSTIQIGVGDYCLPDEAMVTNNTSNGNGLSTLNASALRLIGLGATPRDVRLIGAGSMRIMHLSSSSWIENLTITNGNAMTKFGVADNSPRGGGVYGGGIVTNCVIAGCKAVYGGGCQASTKIWNSRIENCSGSSGAGFHNCTACGTVFVNCSATSNGGAGYTGFVYDCEIVDCSATSYGGALYNVCYVTNTVFRGNRTDGGGGAVYYNTSNLTNLCLDCTFTNNWAKEGGGAICCSQASNCVFVGNSCAKGGGALKNVRVYDSKIAMNRAGGWGGGVFFDTKDKGYVLSNCSVYGNVCSNLSSSCYGGGVYSEPGNTVFGCEISGNYAKSVPGAFSTTGKDIIGTGGGVAQNSTSGWMVFEKCDIHDNYSDSYGGGARGCALKGCHLRNNASGATGLNSFGCHLIDCEIEGSYVARGSALRSTFHNIGNSVTPDNPHVSVTRSNDYVWFPYPNATNCLFYGTRLTEEGGTMFAGENTATLPSALVNCTIVDNWSMYIFRYCKTAAFPMTVENCVFANNFRNNGTTKGDITIVTGSVTSEGLRFNYCAYGSTLVENIGDFFDDGKMVFGDNLAAQPGFRGARDRQHPYSLSLKSTLRGKGQPREWMYATTDIRGEGYPRHDGTQDLVDLGCYQCWLTDPDPLSIMLW